MTLPVNANASLGQTIECGWMDMILHVLRRYHRGPHKVHIATFRMLHEARPYEIMRYRSTHLQEVSILATTLVQVVLTQLFVAMI